jgi:predicted GNAT family acetyltransferase
MCGCYDRPVGHALSGRVASGDIRREERGSSGGHWVVVVDGHEAEMTYSRASPALIIIDHTEVSDALRGRGVGQALALRAVEDARREGLRMIPLCPFATARFERHPEWWDVLSR